MKEFQSVNQITIESQINLDLIVIVLKLNHQKITIELQLHYIFQLNQ